jgi:hypothetical protein
MTNTKGMEIIEIRKDQLEKLYQIPPFHPQQETDFQRAYRMGRNALILELINKVTTLEATK